MPTYKYQMRTSAGEKSNGFLKSENALAAAKQLRSQGNVVLQLTPVSERSTASLGQKLSALNYQSGPTQRDVLNFTTQLAVMIRAGISIRAALDGIADQVENQKFKTILLEIKQDVESGKQFSEALAKHPKLFNPLYINMVRASEMSGSFSKMLERIAAYLQQQIETRAMVIGAMIYPVVIGGLAIAVTIFLLTFVLPRFATVFEGKEAAMPWPTIFLMNLSEFMVEWWWAVGVGMMGVLIAAFFFVKTDPGGWWWDTMKLRIPIFKKMFRALYISRSLQTMGELVNAGVPMLDTLAITGEISGNRHFHKLWNAVHNSVKQGKKIAQPLQRNPYLPKSVVQMVSAGEESGKLGEVLDEISSYYARQLKEVIKTVTSMIEPIMIIVMGSVVGFIAMAIILPIFKLSTLVK
ncbi:Type II secretion system protein F [Poriferisphaera corsica]|uniref:Type II secretion system protein F n=1 Tax=Poriferisphaera corsica TaxID=2528020 RepID=A0A517YXK0_9BACT|nr:type II secretion system F family protein [Poriferisphaera corsica]QDU34947.1 Type II secretion system protein F [Poriferisphaera corsica]